MFRKEDKEGHLRKSHLFVSLCLFPSSLKAGELAEAKSFPGHVHMCAINITQSSGNTGKYRCTSCFQEDIRLQYFSASLRERENSSNWVRVTTPGGLSH
jgi:hypothetical protein